MRRAQRNGPWNQIIHPAQSDRFCPRTLWRFFLFSFIIFTPIFHGFLAPFTYHQTNQFDRMENLSTHFVEMESFNKILRHLILCSHGTVHYFRFVQTKMTNQVEFSPRLLPFAHAQSATLAIPQWRLLASLPRRRLSQLLAELPPIHADTP